MNPPSSRSLTLSWLPPPKICRSAVIQPSRTVSYGTFPLPQEARTFVGGAYSFGEGRKYAQRIIHLTAVGILESEKVCQGIFDPSKATYILCPLVKYAVSRGLDEFPCSSRSVYLDRHGLNRKHPFPVSLKRSTKQTIVQCNKIKLLTSLQSPIQITGSRTRRPPDQAVRNVTRITPCRARSAQVPRLVQEAGVVVPRRLIIYLHIVTTTNLIDDSSQAISATRPRCSIVDHSFDRVSWARRLHFPIVIAAVGAVMVLHEPWILDAGG